MVVGTTASAAKDRPLRILLVAENISLNQSGETSVPYHYFNRFAKSGVEVWAICHARVEDDLRKTLSKIAFDRITFIRDTTRQRWLWWVGGHLPYRVSDLIFNQLIYLVTQRRMRACAAELIKLHDIDVVLQPVPISPKTPSHMYGLGAPVVIGPMCGGLELPPAFRHLDGPISTMAVRFARWLTPVLHWLAPGKLQADALIVGNKRTAGALPSGTKGRVFEVVESGADLDRWEPKTYPVPTGRPVRFVFCGRLVDWKGAQYLVKAFGRIAGKGGMHLDVIGDGELSDEIHASVRQLGLESTVTLHGRIPLESCIAMMRDADVYVMPSLRECGGLALLEAMALGLPIIACNWMGPAEYLNADCAILVDPDSEDAFINGFAVAMERLAQSPELRRKLGEAARSRVFGGYYGWDKKSARVLEILRGVVQQDDAKR